MTENCSNCIHRVVCCPAPKDLICGHYKDEATMIESPCPIGTTIYIRVRTDKKDPTQFFITTATVVGLHLRDTEGYRGLKKEEYLVVRGSCGFSNHIPFSHIGKKVFFNEQDAKMYGKEEEYL